MNDEEVIRRLIREKLNRYARRAIYHIRRLPKEAMQSGDDSPLRNIWEEWVVQVRGEQAIMYDLYEDMIRSACRSVAESLPKEEQGLLWFETEGCADWKGQDIPYGDPVMEALENELFKRVCEIAGDMELPERVEEYIDRLGS